MFVGGRNFGALTVSSRPPIRKNANSRDREFSEKKIVNKIQKVNKMPPKADDGSKKPPQQPSATKAKSPVKSKSPVKGKTPGTPPVSSGPAKPESITSGSASEAPKPKVSNSSDPSQGGGSGGASGAASTASGSGVRPSAKAAQGTATTAPSATAGKTLQTRVLVGSDDDVIEDWKVRRIAAIVPMNMAIRPFLERAICAKMKWEKVENVTYMEAKAGPGGVDGVKPTSDVMQINLTPHQLGLKPDGMAWVWLRKVDPGGETHLLTPKEHMQRRVERWYQYYEPSKITQAAALLQDYEGAEELLFNNLQAKYGPEPTMEQLHRKIVPRKAQVPQEGPKTVPSDRISEGSRGGRLDEAELGNIAVLMSRTTTTLLIGNYYKRWVDYLRRRKEHKRIMSYMTGTQDNWYRKEYYNKLKVYSQTKKTKRQLTVSKQLAFKQESLVGDLTTENSYLKGELRKSQAQIEVLETSNAKRLEAVFASSEGAILQIKALTNELFQKDRVINELEAKLMNVGNKMLEASEEKDKAITIAAAGKLQDETEIVELREKVINLEGSLYHAQEQLRKLAPSQAQAAFCEHCPHFFQVLHEIEVHEANTKMLRSRVEDAEERRQKAEERLSRLQAEFEQAVAEARRSALGGNASMLSGEAEAALGNNSMLVNNATFAGATNATFSGSNRELSASEFQNSPGMSGHDGPTSARSNDRRNVSFATQAPNILANDSFRLSGSAASGDSNPPKYAHNPQFAELQPPDEYLSDARTTRKAPNTRGTQPLDDRAEMSMQTFFAREEKCATERIRLSLDKQTAPKTSTPLGAAYFAQRQRGVDESLERQRFTAAQRDTGMSSGSLPTSSFARQYEAIQAQQRGQNPLNMFNAAMTPIVPHVHPALTRSYAAEPPIPGMFGAVPRAQTAADARMAQQPAQYQAALDRALDRQVAIRPEAQLPHTSYVPGPTSNAGNLRRDLFSFNSTSRN